MSMRPEIFRRIRHRPPSGHFAAELSFSRDFDVTKIPGIPAACSGSPAGMNVGVQVDGNPHILVVVPSKIARASYDKDELAEQYFSSLVAGYTYYKVYEGSIYQPYFIGNYLRGQRKWATYNSGPPPNLYFPFSEWEDGVSSLLDPPQLGHIPGFSP